ncbi:hypothetical protein [Cellvibrio polysaccharolyticus]|uniref:Uncharacterized protein n=1 Tax=Cellvibrio polysaccharolyticus TaxID=2082724 RepID=A0A928V3P3_9GAMM|nr:hypothetical protein [Cellvibrio polysaccharolyticus]MBE8716630.1 hypothetical protein [Cellvibrio polysaccharolyticus]
MKLVSQEYLADLPPVSSSLKTLQSLLIFQQCLENYGWLTTIGIEKSDLKKLFFCGAGMVALAG